MPRTTATAKARGDLYKSGAERSMAERLELLKLSAGIDHWRYESQKFKVGGGWYTPDYQVIAFGHMLQIEVKGHWREAAKLRYRSAAMEYGEYIWVVAKVTRGGWNFEAYYTEDQAVVDGLL